MFKYSRGYNVCTKVTAVYVKFKYLNIKINLTNTSAAVKLFLLDNYKYSLIL